MNQIEQKFYDAFIAMGHQDDSIQSQVPIGIYIADFVTFPYSHVPTIVEIDGHEWHKTKEQRYHDYVKERFFISQGYLVIRFMGSEVFLNAYECAKNASEVSYVFERKVLDSYEKGYCEGGE